MTYRSLFLLDSPAASIFEIKRLDVQSANPADVYFWLYFDHASRQLSVLEFASMKAEGEEQQRQFTQVMLQFNASGGTFTPASGAPALTLRTVAPPTLPAALETALFAFFGLTTGAA